ncbi:unnamed protein product [Rotaria socialis]|uniref:Uncharacterized protein n=1 Tax=Rotaria socialis TaxID=392032 RepID=A0A821K4T8_9BILA|nr:unnamed protein product [Rotaria socialis]CAF3314087.1 unnamed protein product [Rotaria socialis]CAF3336580.1 unnamed protein product [Rotaria socialis]CAF3439137.1 unnamed protein product [Rotaria socialis]CAF3556768.1 unnamed protein product [Rotaria socialis]
MIKIATFVCWLATFFVININAEPYLIFPQHMLPPIGHTYNVSFTGTAVTTPVAGVYSIQAVTANNQETIIGYRLWEGYTRDTREILYTVSYSNGTSFQAGVDPDTGKCFAAERLDVNCTGWSSTDVLKWNNKCLEKSKQEPKSSTKMIVQADTSNLRRPIGLNLTITIEGTPIPLFSTFQFSSETKGKHFPHVKCNF